MFFMRHLRLHSCIPGATKPGQRSRLQEKPTTRSKPQEPHRTRTRPLSQNTTIQEGAKLLFDELGNFMFPLSLIGEKGFQLHSHHGIKKAIRGIAWLILRKPDLHRQRNRRMQTATQCLN